MIIFYNLCTTGWNALIQFAAITFMLMRISLMRVRTVGEIDQLCVFSVRQLRTRDIVSMYRYETIVLLPTNCMAGLRIHYESQFCYQTRAVIDIFSRCLLSHT